MTNRQTVLKAQWTQDLNNIFAVIPQLSLCSIGREGAEASLNIDVTLRTLKNTCHYRRLIYFSSTNLSGGAFVPLFVNLLNFILPIWQNNNWGGSPKPNKKVKTWTKIFTWKLSDCYFNIHIQRKYGFYTTYSRINIDYLFLGFLDH
jgi:hypothetical protein